MKPCYSQNNRLGIDFPVPAKFLHFNSCYFSSQQSSGQANPLGIVITSIFGRSHKAAGTSPVKLLPSRVRVSSLVNEASTLGIGPVKSLPFNLNAV